MSTLFISYRRDDSSGYAINLYDRLASRFGHDRVFMDIDQIKPGEDFHDVIHEKLKSVEVAVVLIGKHWLNIPGETGRRLDNPDDWVRLEIATLLERKIRVIPVLVGGATMPKSTELPECMQPLARRQTHEISDNRFRTDVDRLIQQLETMVSVQSSSQQTVSPTPTDSKKGSNWFAIGLGVVALLFGAVAFYYDFSPLPPITKDKAADRNETATTTPTVEKKTETRLSFEPEMVRIPAGKFMMGSPTSEKDRYSGEGPQREVIIAAFEMGKYEVTFDEYDAFAKATIRKLSDDEGWGRGKRPVINVSWNDAQAYVQWLSGQTGKQYRLPTEAEWEYAARAGEQTRYWWGDNIGNNNAACWNCGSQWDIKQTAPIGSFNANAFELHDTAGNVAEWVQDCWHENYANAPSDGSAWRDANGGDCNRRVVRGGSWVGNPRDLRSANRDRFSTVIAYDIVGFRIARDL